ncbi:hypothetical protein G9A89_001912 [Geosiphon pyriformis]|nr:hypothetical protein G9A89_001912 [Geosiphon pyriformis]
MNYCQYSKEKKKKKNLPGTLTKPGKLTTIKKTHQPRSSRKAIKKKRRETKKTNLKPTKPTKPALVAGEDPIQPTPDQSHHVFLSTWVAPDKNYWMRTYYYYKPCHCKHYEYSKRQGKWDNEPCLACGEQLLDEGMWNDILDRGGTCNTLCQYIILISNWVIYTTRMRSSEWSMPNKILEIKNNSPEPTDIVLNLAPMRKEQEQCLEKINTQLCNHCLIPCDFQFCNDCDLIYNLLSCMIYTIPEKKEPISSCTLELESVFDPNSNSNNDDDKNTDFSSIQNGNENNSKWNFNSNPEIYITLSDLTKEQTLKWFSDNEEGIMPECVHDINAGFDLRYLGKDAIKLESHSHICIDLKIALKIPATTMVQLASRSSLAKRGITIRGGIIDTGYVGNIMAILQNNLKKTYIIEPNKKIAQAIFLPLIRVAQLVSVGKKKELGITARGIQGFGPTDRTDIPVNMAEEEIIGQEEIISTGQVISIPPYDQYMVVIERKVKDKDQIFETETSLCESREIGLINLHIPAKSHNHIKIFIYNTTEDTITIPEGTIIRYMSTELENQPPSIISDFPQLCGYVNITSQTIYR